MNVYLCSVLQPKSIYLTSYLSMYVSIILSMHLCITQVGAIYTLAMDELSYPPPHPYYVKHFGRLEKCNMNVINEELGIMMKYCKNVTSFTFHLRSTIL